MQDRVIYIIIGILLDVQTLRAFQVSKVLLLCHCYTVDINKLMRAHHIILYCPKIKEIGIL